MSIVAAAAAAAASASRRAAALAASSSQRAAAPALLNVASIEVPANVSVTRKGSELTVTGPLGTSKTDLASLDGRGDGALRLSADGRSIEVASVSKPFFGTLQTLLKNKIEVSQSGLRREKETIKIEIPSSSSSSTPPLSPFVSQPRPLASSPLSLLHPQGVTKGFYVQLRIVGIGYRAALSPDGSTLTLKLGHSHDCAYVLPPSLKAVVPEPTLVGLWGLDKNQVTQAAANVIALRKPSPYKGKGVRVEGTSVKLKPGKRK